MNIVPPTRFYALSFLVKTLRESIFEGKWEHSLPPERELANQLQVSRSTLRKALRILEEEGIVIINQGKPTLIGIPEAAGTQEEPYHVSLVYSAPGSDPSMHDDRKRLGSEIEIRLHAAGIAYTHVHAPSQTTRIEAVVRKAERPGNRNLWLLLQPTPAQEEWFAAYAPTNTLLACAGSTAHHLPYVDVHHEAVGRHIGALANQRHYQTLHLLCCPATAARAQHLLGGISATFRHQEEAIRLHRLAPENFHRGIALLLKQLERQPASLLTVVNSEFIPATLFHIAHTNRRLPEDLSLLSAAGPLTLPGFGIELAYYENLESKIAKAIAQQVIDVIHIDGLRFQRRLFIPEFEPGKTLGLYSIPPGTSLAL